MSEQKQHKPTARKLREARKDGKVMRAPMFSQSFSMVTLCLSVFLLLRYLWFNNRMLLEYKLDDAAHKPVETLGAVFMGVLFLSAVPLVVAAFTGVLVQGLVAGFAVEWKTLIPKASRFGQGLKQISRGLKQSWETLAKVALFGAISYWLLQGHLYRFSSGLLLDADHALSFLCSELIYIASVLLSCFMLLSGMEFLLRYREFYKDLSMSDQDVRQEHKNDEGDPHLQSARKALHRELLSQEIVERVKKARVIIVQRNSPAEDVNKAPAQNFRGV